MKVLETRETAEGYKRRRYETAGGTRFTTIEVPIEIWNRVNTVGRQRNRAAEATRAMERERLRNQAVLLMASWNSTAHVARAIGVSLRTVQRWVK